MMCFVVSVKTKFTQINARSDCYSTKTLKDASALTQKKTKQLNTSKIRSSELLFVKMYLIYLVCTSSNSVQK